MGKQKENTEPVQGVELEDLESVVGEAVGETTEKAAEEAVADDKVKELEDRLLRQMAEFDNYRKRTTKEKEEIGLTVKVKCVSELLPVVDNFERAMQSECVDEEFKKGMKMIFDTLVASFNKLGVEEIVAEGEAFNPELHYAVSRVEDENLGENVVAAVMQKGYKLGDKVIRHAMVAVANP